MNENIELAIKVGKLALLAVIAFELYVLIGIGKSIQDDTEYVRYYMPTASDLNSN